MATEMTPQERADLKEIARKLVLQINEITPMQWDKHDDKDQAIVLAALQTTRRAALLEAAEEIERFIDYSGGCVGTQNDPRVVAVNRFITINIVPLLARLASEGE